MRSFGLGLLAVAAASLLACSDDGFGPNDPDEVGQATEPIINGYPDTTHDAVVAIVSNYHACSATIVAKNGTNLYLLTAAHCVQPNSDYDPEYAILGEDYASSSTYYPIQDCQAHTSYNQQIFDFAMCRATGAGSSTPVIEAADSPDGLSGNSAVKHVGYGKTSVNDNDNSTRYYFDGHITDLETMLLWYNQPDGGPCSGDSGGPQLAGNPEKVVGVTSFGDQNCAEYGASGRVSQVYDNFVMAYINNGPIGPLTCDQCFQAATTGDGSCMSAVNACFNNTDCNALVECFNGCATYSCQNGCIDAHPSGYNIFLGIYDCVCDGACVTECEGDGTCNTGGTGGTGGTGNTGGTGGTGNTGGTATGTPTGTGGTAGSTSTGTDWIAGTEDDRNYSGELLSGCSVRARQSRGQARTVLLWGLAVAVALGARRRRLV